MPYNKLPKSSNLPKQYQQGWTEFYKLKFKVTPDVLIPRPETELLVDEVLIFIRQLPTTRSQPTVILDVGTGSGNIAISLAVNNPHFAIIATDISEKALKTAKLNAKLHQVENQITFLKNDLLINLNLLSIIHNINPMLLLIVANLPYIPSARIPYLDSSVKDFEPLIALDGGEDGFKLYRKLFAQVKAKNLNPKLLVGEIDYTHGELAYQEARKYFPQAVIEVKKDLAYKQRILKILSDNESTDWEVPAR